MVGCAICGAASHSPFCEPMQRSLGILSDRRRFRHLVVDVVGDQAASRLWLGGSTAPTVAASSFDESLGRSKPPGISALHPRVAFLGASPLSHRNSILVRQETASARLQNRSGWSFWFVVRLLSTAWRSCGRGPEKHFDQHRFHSRWYLVASEFGVPLWLPR